MSAYFWRRYCLWLILSFLTLALLPGCTSAQKPPAASTSSAAAILPEMTLLPTRQAAAGTPDPHAILLTTRLGQEIQLGSMRLEPNEYVAFHTESVPQGIPLANGVEVAYRYLARVEFGVPSADWEQPGGEGAWPVSLTLSDGGRIQASLGFKAHHNIHVTGASDRYGNIDILLSSVESLVFPNPGTPAAVPTSLPAGSLITVKVSTGELVQVSDPRIFARCMYEVYCCHDETLRGLPLAGPADLAFGDFKSAVFTGQNLVKIGLPDGSTREAKLRACAICPDTAWRLEGKAVLGDFEIELSSVKTITR